MPEENDERQNRREPRASADGAQGGTNGAESRSDRGARRGRRGDATGPGGSRGGGRGGRGGGRDERDERGGRGRGPRREREERDEPEFQETLVDVYRCSATVKGGRRLSFGALVAVGDQLGRVGIGYGKAKEVPGAIQKAIKKGRRSMKRFPISGGGTIPHRVMGRFGASQVVLVPARPGTGVIAGTAVKAILEAGGLTNVLTKSFGSNNTRNLVKATMNALETLRSHESVAQLRGVPVK